MNIENLKETYPSLLKYLRENGYSKWRLSLVETGIRSVLNDGSRSSIISYEQLAEEWRSRYSVTTLHSQITILWMIRDFDLYRKYPKVRSYSPLANRSFPPEYNHYWGIVDCFRKRALENGLSINSICVMERHALQFFEYMIEKGCKSFKEIKEKDILSFCYDGSKNIRGHQFMYHIKYVLRENGCEKYKEECIRIASLIPKIKIKEKVYQSLTQEEIEKVKNALKDNNCNISLRDRAIVTVALYTGIRSCDIVNIQLNSIDFRNETINIKQQKTSIPLVLPLRPVVGNVIIDYVQKERPITECQSLFVTNVKPYGILSAGEVRSLVAGFFLKVGVRLLSGLKGTHLFRHNVAMTLLNEQVSNPIISRVLGHTSPVSIEPYLGADMEILRNCVISIEEYPLREEVLYL